MRINEIENTCSMHELGDVYLPNDLNIKTKKEFFEKLKNDVEDTYISLTECNQLLYNCESNTKSVKTKLQKLGFKNIYSYKGNSSNRVYTWILNLKTKANQNLIKKIYN